MKNKFFIIAAACLMLTACGNSSDDAEVTSLPETSAAETESEIFTEETTTTASETEPAESVSETETTAADSEITALAETFTFDDIDPNNRINIGSYNNCYGSIDEKSAYVMLNATNDDDSKYIFNVVNKADMSSIGSVEIPAEYYDSITVVNEGGIIANVLAYDWKQISDDSYGAVYTLYKIHDDFTVQASSDYSYADTAVTVGSHKVAKNDIDLVDADTGEVIVYGSSKEDDEYGFYTRSQYYQFSIDDNSFVYFTSGYECIPGFGIYDFKTGENRPVDNSDNLVPFGTDGKYIYSQYGAWDGIPTAVYATDIETLESKKLFDITGAGDDMGYISFKMPPSADFLYGFDFYRYESTEPAYIKKYNIATGEVTDAVPVPELKNAFFLCFDGDSMLFIDSPDKLIRVTLSD